MNRIQIMLPALLGLSLSAMATSANDADVPKTNVVLILIDDLSWKDLGCYLSNLLLGVDSVVPRR